MPLVFCNGLPASPDDLAALALVNYGHFTTLQVRAMAVRGLDLHLRRLREANQHLFGSDIQPERLYGEMAAALRLAQCENATLRITAFSRHLSLAQLSPSGAVDLLISVAPPGETPPGPVRLQSAPFVRSSPAIKHVGIFPAVERKRAAQVAGYDDVLFVDANDRLLEGSFWNLGLWDGRQVLWPKGPALLGTQQQLLQAGLEQLGVPQRWSSLKRGKMGQYGALFTCNARGQQGVSCLDDQLLPDASEILQLLDRALSTQPWQPL